MRKKLLNDGTNGYRFNGRFVNGLFRHRVNYKRWEITNGHSMIGFHYGYRSLYIQKPKALRKLTNFAR